MPSVLAGLEPQSLWAHFEAILGIPHGSGSEKALGDHVLGLAKRLGLPAERDKAGNVIVRKPATAGRESARGVILQGHLDMVNEKNAGVTHDFSRDALVPALKGGWVTASGTTLGADNGIGVAAALAVMEDRQIGHGPLEFLFTVDEETGLTGAREIKPGALRGAYLLNLDSEDLGTFTIGCSGGADTELRLAVRRKASRAKSGGWIKVSGLRGGHSGIDIHQGRANAIQLIAHVLSDARKRFDYDLGAFEAGSKRNAIPREARAEIAFAPGRETAWTELASSWVKAFREIYGSVESDLAISFEPGPAPKGRVLTAASRDRLLDVLLVCPHGVLRMHPEIAGLTETSTNLAIVKSRREAVQIICSSRSSIAPALEGVRRSLRSLASLSGAGIRQPAGYPGWAPDLQSPLLAAMKEIHRRALGVEARVVAVHAGLECGIIGEKFPGMTMISFGPTIEHPHSPDERVEVASVAKFWTLLTAALRELA